MENPTNGNHQPDQTLTKLHDEILKDAVGDAVDGELGSLRPPEFYSYTNSLTAREMETLVAICDTLIPSIDGSEIGHVGGDDVAVFYGSSASQTGTHHRVAGVISGRLRHPKKWLLRTALWVLSTWIGSIILCGRKSFSGEFPFPYCRRFCRLPQRRREEIMLSWAFSYFSLLRMFFKAMKLITALIFFTQVDEKGENLTWKAIGYRRPNSPQNDQLKDPTIYNEQIEKSNKKKPEEIFGPLYRGIVDLRNPRKAVIQTLRELGFPVSVQKRKDNGNQNRPESSISSPAMIIRCDAVVVGSGSGGGVVAGLLAKAGYKVLVLEEGQYFARSKLSLLEGHVMDKMYLSSGLLGTADMNTLILAGATVGGGSTINWSASIRTPENVMKEWSDKYEIELFESELYKKAMDVVCERMGVQSGISEEGFNNAILRNGCEKLGFPVETIPRNSPEDHYCGFCCLGCKKGEKKGTSETWLVDLVESGNGAILPGCEAIRVLQKQERGKKTATGIAFAFENAEICAVESKVTIVACGALRTPHLLKQSGLKNPNIGKNLHIHPVTMVWGWFPEEKWPEKYKTSYEGGIMTTMSRTSGEAIIQTPALHPGMFSGLIPWTSGKDFKTRMLKFSRTAHIFALTRDQGSGTVRSPNSINYSLDEADEEKLKKGVEKILRILGSAGAEEIGTHNSEGKSLNVKKASSKEFERFVREESLKQLKNFSAQIGSAHQMGSCRMGVWPENSAVRPTGETWEVGGLFVADSSVFPTALGVNPMVTVQAIAYCVGQYVVDVLRRKKRGL